MAVKRYTRSAVDRRSSFPAGHFRGVIKEMEEGQNPDGTIGNIGFQLQGNEVIEADTDPGKRPHFVRIPTWMVVEEEDKRGRKQKVTLMTADIDPEDENVPFMLRQALGQFLQLAAAVGAGTVTEDGGVEADVEAFIEECRNAQYEDQTVEFIVTHRAEKKDGKVVKGGRTFVDTVFVVPEPGEEGGEGETTEETTEEGTEETEGEEVPEGEETPEEEPEEEEAPAPHRPAARSTPARTLAGAKARQATTKASGQPKGSGKPKFVRRGGKK